MTNATTDPRTVEDLMTEDLIAVRPSDRVGRARDLLTSLGFNALPVMEANQVVGIVTTSDLVDDWPEHELVSTIMTESPYSIAADAGLREAADQMILHRIHHLMVEAEGEAIGLLSSLDLLHAFVTGPADRS